MALDLGWPISVASLRRALNFTETQGDSDELELFARAACERIDVKTGRDTDPTRHLKGDGTLPIIFIQSARTTAKLWWQQEKNGPKGQPVDPSAQSYGPPMGADLPRRVEGWLSPYQPRPGIG